MFRLCVATLLCASLSGRSLKNAMLFHEVFNIIPLTTTNVLWCRFDSGDSSGSLGRATLLFVVASFGVMRLILQRPDVEDDRWRDWEWSLGLNWLALRMLGVWPNELHLTKEPWSVKSRIPLIIFYTTLMVILPQMYALYLVMDELPLAIDNFVTNCGSITACAKYFFLWRNKHVLWPVIEGASSDWLRAKPKWEREVMIKHAARARLFTVGGYWLLTSCYIGFVFLPLAGFSIRIINNITDHGERQLLFQSYYPYEYWRSPYFELTEFMHLFVGFFIGMAISTPDNYFGALVFHVSAQFEILDYKLEHCIGKRDTMASSIFDRQFSRVLGIFIDRHVQLIKTVAAIERAFCFVILAQVLNMSLLICCIGFQVIGILENGLDKQAYLPILTLVGIIGAFMMNTLVDCYASETLATASSRLFDSTYNCKWYTVSPVSTRNLLPMMAISLLPQRLTAGKIFYLSMATYCSLLKSAGGYITTLLAVRNQ